jgi:hypothetical protein
MLRKRSIRSGASFVSGAQLWSLLDDKPWLVERPGFDAHTRTRGLEGGASVAGSECPLFGTIARATSGR